MVTLCVAGSSFLVLVSSVLGDVNHGVVFALASFAGMGTAAVCRLMTTCKAVETTVESLNFSGTLLWCLFLELWTVD